MRPTHLLLAAPLAALLILPATSAQAEERSCRGRIGATTLDNLRVPPGATCQLDRTRLQGNIVVERNGTLLAEAIVVIGSVQAEGARRVSITEGSRIGGSVQVEQGGSASVLDSRIDADIQLLSNGGTLLVRRNQVGGNIQVNQNNGGAEIRRNVVDGNLQCQANSPAPTGGGNVVDGSKEDQCARL